MSFQISALRAALFADLPSLSGQQLAARHIQKSIVDAYPGAPCRVSLEDAQIGETVYLLNFTHHDQATPFKSSHAIFVRETAVPAHPTPDEIPTSLSTRLLSVRAFNTAHNMINADITEGIALAEMIEDMFGDENIRYLHVHYARPGCYAARVDRT
jgi:hypothetical protein